MSDLRRRLRAHWPPRRINVVQVHLPESLYADVYLSAKAEGWSLSEEIRARLSADISAEGRKPDRASAGSGAVGAVDGRPGGGPASRSERSGP